MNQFNMNEGTLHLPFAYEDASMTILKFPASQSSLVITRSHADPNMTLKVCAEMQQTLFQREFKNVMLGERIETTLGGQFPAIEFSAEFHKDSRIHYQINLLLKCQTYFLALTYTQNRPFNQQDLQHWQTIKTDFVPAKLMQAQFGGE